LVDLNDEKGFTFETINIFADTPPMNDIVVFEWKVDILVGPVDGFFIGRDLSPYFFLLLTVVDFEGFVVRNVELFHSG
jgi:hypothetical protein